MQTKIKIEVILMPLMKMQTVRQKLELVINMLSYQ